MQRRNRETQRVPFGAAVDLWKARDPTAVQALDISSGGLFLRTDEQIRQGSYLTLRIQLPGHRAFTAMCRVVRQGLDRALQAHMGVGVEILDIQRSDRRRIERFVADRTAYMHAAA